MKARHAKLFVLHGQLLVVERRHRRVEGLADGPMKPHAARRTRAGAPSASQPPSPEEEEEEEELSEPVREPAPSEELSEPQSARMPRPASADELERSGAASGRTGRNRVPPSSDTNMLGL